MKRNTSILIKTTVLVLAFMLLLGGGITSLSFSHSGTKPNDNNFLTPDLAITAPTSQELLQKKFGVYNTVTEENGKSLVTIFSEEQIKDILTRREKGEWFWLSSEEMLFLIEDTVRMFETYDAVCIRDLEGNVRRFESTDTDGRYRVTLERVKVLNSAVYESLKTENPDMRKYITLTDCKYPLSYYEALYLDTCKNPWYNSMISRPQGMILWTFGEDNIHFWTEDVWSRYEIFGGYDFWEERTIVYPK